MHLVLPKGVDRCEGKMEGNAKRSEEGNVPREELLGKNRRRKATRAAKGIK